MKQDIDLLSPSPYAVFDGLSPAERLAAIRLREHERRKSHFGDQDRAEAYRSMCAELVEALSEAWPYVPQHHGPVTYKVTTAITKARKLLEEKE